MPVCRNWQTRQTQNLLIARSCGFKSRHRQKILDGYPVLCYPVNVAWKKVEYIHSHLSTNA